MSLSQHLFSSGSIFSTASASASASSASALKQYVTDHYRKFIDTSKEIAQVEGDMVTLNNQLNEYRAVIKGLMESNMAGGSTAAAASATAASAAASSSSASAAASSAGSSLASASASSLPKQVQDDVAALNELAEELGGLIYERKLEQAVSIIETAYEKLDELDPKAGTFGSPDARQR